MNKYTANLLGIFAFAMVVAFISFVLSHKGLFSRSGQSDEPVFCTQEAKICPDGTAVGRSGPECAFAPCPSVPALPQTSDVSTTASWETMKSIGGHMTIQYPAQLGTTYMRAVEWPPRVTTEPGAFTCFETQTSPLGVTTKRIIGGVQYCVTTQSEGAAGSTYVTYTYLTEKEQTRIKLVFTIQETQCLNYDEPQQSECKAERDRFSADALATRVLGTAMFLKSEAGEI